MTSAAPSGGSEPIELQVAGARSVLTATEVVTLAGIMVPGFLAIIVVVLGGPPAIAVLMLMLQAVTAPFAVGRLRRPVGILRCRPSLQGLEFGHGTLLPDAMRKAAFVLLLGPLEGLRLLATGGGDLPLWTVVALWFGLPAFFGLRRETRSWGVVRVVIGRDGVLAESQSVQHLHRWADLAEADGRPHPLRRLLRPPGQKIFPEAFLASDPDVVARVIDFYRVNPGARRELGTGAAVERLRRGDFDMTS